MPGETSREIRLGWRPSKRCANAMLSLHQSRRYIHDVKCHTLPYTKTPRRRHGQSCKRRSVAHFAILASMVVSLVLALRTSLLCAALIPWISCRRCSASRCCCFTSLLCESICRHGTAVRSVYFWQSTGNASKHTDTGGSAAALEATAPWAERGRRWSHLLHTGMQLLVLLPALVKLLLQGLNLMCIDVLTQQTRVWERVRCHRHTSRVVPAQPRPGATEGQ